MGWLEDVERRRLLAKKRVVDHPYDDAEYATDLVLGTDAPKLIALCRQLGDDLDATARWIESCPGLTGPATRWWQDQPPIEQSLTAYREATT